MLVELVGVPPLQRRPALIAITSVKVLRRIPTAGSAH
jgi:hypothetical protein